MDFFIETYHNLLRSFLEKKLSFFTYREYCEKANLQGSILRHDVDRIPENALKMAELEMSLGIRGSYYFRIVPESFDIKIISKIAALGHEIGYHYEEMDLIYRQFKIKNSKLKIAEGDLVDEAYNLFCTNLEKIRNVADIKTICMHGSPLSPFDNKAIWKKYNYRDLGINGEPYFDINWNEWAYLTDTGRRWNGSDVSIRDKVQSKYKFNFRHTNDIITSIEKLPGKIMFTIHPERWNNQLIPWLNQLVMQNIKNVVKKVYLIKKRT